MSARIHLKRRAMPRQIIPRGHWPCATLPLYEVYLMMQRVSHCLMFSLFVENARESQRAQAYKNRTMATRHCCA